MENQKELDDNILEYLVYYGKFSNSGEVFVSRSTGKIIPFIEIELALARLVEKGLAVTFYADNIWCTRALTPEELVRRKYE
jgi:hypothetical protein